MALGSVVTTFFICIIFNMLLPSGDVGSDVYLMYTTLTFNLGIGLKLLGCKLCYFKTEDDIYYNTRKFEHKNCNWCIKEKDSVCGLYPKIMEKIISYESMDLCTPNQTIRRTINSAYEKGNCNINNDDCCLSTVQEKYNRIDIQNLDPKKLFRCFSKKPLEYCYVVGNTSFRNCMSLKEKAANFKKQRTQLFRSFLSSSTEKSLHFFDFVFDNNSVIIRKVDSLEYISDCGLLLQLSSKEVLDGPKPMEYCNEDSCLSHIKSLHSRSTKITDLSGWRANNDYVFGISVGGATCKMLQIYGLAMLFPILLNLGFNMNVFTEDVKHKNANFIELIPVIMLMYPQYKTLKILLRYALFHRDENQLKYDKEEIERRISPLEPFLESCMQVSSISNI